VRLPMPLPSAPASPVISKPFAPVLRTNNSSLFNKDPDNKPFR